MMINIVVTPKREYTGLNGSTYKNVRHFHDSMRQWYGEPEQYSVYSLDNFNETVNDRVIDDLTENFIFKIYTDDD